MAVSRRAHQEALSQTGRVAPPRLHTAPEISAIVPVRVHPPAVLCCAVPAVLLKISCFVTNLHPGWSTYLKRILELAKLSASSPIRRIASPCTRDACMYAHARVKGVRGRVPVR
jgi:hypothetical protein